MKPIDNATYEREAREEGLQQGIQHGREQGREEGKEEGKLEAALGLLANGVDIDVIVKSLGISKKKVENLALTTH
ncbi:MAG: hypothetical protein GY757_46480 [bacterium]|nr:hypothetical protein [bacterium]